jgi:DNA-binding GntR family transcriptional regulator
VDHFRDSVADHFRILADIERGDGGAAFAHMQEHVRNAQREALRLVTTFNARAADDGSS